MGSLARDHITVPAMKMSVNLPWITPLRFGNPSPLLRFICEVDLLELDKILPDHDCHQRVQNYPCHGSKSQVLFAENSSRRWSRNRVQGFWARTWSTSFCKRATVWSGWIALRLVRPRIYNTWRTIPNLHWSSEHCEPMCGSFCWTLILVMTFSALFKN